jgi:toxin ParE1/3/4
VKTVFYAPEAEVDLLEIGTLIALDSEKNAEAFVAKLREKANAIAQMPRIYRLRPDFGPDLRSAVLGKYLLVFRIVPEGIEILHVVHGARDLTRLFEP